MLRGTFTALITPFRPDLSVDEAALRRLVNFQIEQGISGLVPVGTTGESPTTTAEEDRRIFEIVVEEARGRVPVFCGTGSNNTIEAVRYTLNAKAAGADGALVVCPYYNKPTRKGLLLHYRKIADDTDFPIIVYNIKGRTGINIDTDTLMQLAEHPRIVGVKEASGDLQQMKAVLERAPKNFSVLCGDDALTLELIKMGGHGVVSVASGVLPRRVSDFVALALAGDWPRAEAEHRALEPLFKTLFIETNPIPVKTSLAMMGFCAEQFRLPLCTMEPQNRERLAAVLQTYGAI